MWGQESEQAATWSGFLQQEGYAEKNLRDRGHAVKNLRWKVEIHIGDSNVERGAAKNSTAAVVR